MIPRQIRAASGRHVPIALLLLAATAAACRDEPEVVVQDARDALAANDVDGFLALCEPRLAAFLREAEQVQRQSGRALKVLRDGRPRSTLLPKGEIGDTEEAGKRAVVVVRLGDVQEKVPLRLVRGRWKLDLMETERFLDQMKPTATP